MSLSPGTRIGSYEVTEALGAGGMGEVYRARDTKLGRDVAVKALPAAFADDAERVARFTREAQVLAALNHPHIGQIYGVEESAAGRFLVLELVDGQTLADRLSRGALPLDEALSIARQVADAIGAAHDKGIIHRDLKPANIALTAAGDVKVLDFGLAKPGSIAATSSGTAGLSVSPTITSPALVTGAGMILGTAAYMSPEQAKGREADKRSDVWAFGCVLFEMLTGQRPFVGEDVTETLAAVLMKEPDWSLLPSALPRPVRTLLERSLAKDARKRLPDIGVAQFLLEERQEATPVASVTRVVRRERLFWIAAAIAIGAVGFMAARLLSPTAVTSSVHFAVSPPPGKRLVTGVGANVAISPDGRYIVFPVIDVGGQSTLALRSLDDEAVHELPGTVGGAMPFWAPDSRGIAFFANNQLKRTDRAGAPVQVISDVQGAQGGAWAPDGTILVGSTAGPLQQVASSGGTLAPLTTVDESQNETTHRHPHLLPDGRRFLYLASGVTARGAIYAGSLDDSTKVRVLSSDSDAIYLDGYLLFLRDSTLLAQSFDPSALAVRGDPMAIARNVWFNPTVQRGFFTGSQDSTLVYRVTTPAAPSQLAWLDRSGRELQKVGEAGDQSNIQLSPDGRRVLLSVLDPAKQSRDLWVQDLESGVRTRFSFGEGEEIGGIWSPDGKRILFSSVRSDVLDLFVRAADGSGSEEKLVESGDNKYPTAWSRDGRFAFYHTGNARSRTGNDIWLLPMDGEQPRVLLGSPFNEQNAQLSPDGRWVAYNSTESGRGEVYVIPSAGSGGKWQISPTGGAQVRWGPDGSELFYVTDSATTLMRVPVKGRGTAFEAGTPEKMFDIRFRNENYRGYGIGAVYDISPDGRRILANLQTNQATAPDELTVVTNWTSLLR